MNDDILFYFNQPDEAENWVWRMENRVGDWISQHDKSFWYLVLWESKRTGILKESITRMNFTTLLVRECPDAVSESDTVETIFHSLEKFRYKSELKELDKLHDGHPLRKWVAEVSDLLSCDVPSGKTSGVFSLEQRMQEYLTMTTVNESFVKVLVRPIYNGKVATMSVETYVSQRFMDEQRPSQRVIFECVDEKLTEEKVEMLHGRFCSLRNTKLFIASTHAFSGNVKKEAECHDIGLVLVNSKRQVNENDFVLPRTQGSQQSDEVQWHRMLTGEAKMTVSILAYDGRRIDDSLSFILYKYASCNKKHLFVEVPFLSDAEIEAEALRLVQPKVDFYVSLLHQCGPQDRVPDCNFDPYVLAEDMGLTVNRGKTGRKLGQIDIDQKTVTLSNRLSSYDPGDVFSMAHEIGHHIFHSRLSEKAKDGVHAIVSRNRKWMEHHANYFASCLLMPAAVIRLLYTIYWKKEFKNEKVAPLRVKADYFHDPRFQRVVCPVARKMNVSAQAAYIRLKKMGLLLDKA